MMSAMTVARALDAEPVKLVQMAMHFQVATVHGCGSVHIGVFAAT